MSATRHSPDHRETATSACSLALALLEGRSISWDAFDRELRADPAEPGRERSVDTKRAALRKACTYLRRCGLSLVRDPHRPGSVRLDRERSLAPADALAALDGEQALLEDLGSILVTLAGTYEGLHAVEAHGAAAKLLRDFSLNGSEGGVAPTTSRTQRLLRDALAETRVIRVRYRKENGEVVERLLEPQRHVQVEGHDFLVAVDRGDHRVKTFHYRRFLRVEPQDERYIPRDLDLGCLFSPPFAHTTAPDPVRSEVTFLVGADREAAVRATLTRLCCHGCGTWASADGGAGGTAPGTAETGGSARSGRPAGPALTWTVEAVDAAKAASFALGLGIEVVAPRDYRRAYLDAIDATRRAFAGGMAP